MIETVENYCKYCGNLIPRKYIERDHCYESDNSYMKHKYCDRICMRKAYLAPNDKTQSWSTAHTTARNKAKLFDINTQVCELCEKNGKMDIHHKDFNENNNSLENLQVLCRSCHMKIHHPKGICKLDGCNEYVDSYGYCEKHYLRYKKYGNPLILNRGNENYILVDVNDNKIRDCEPDEVKKCVVENKQRTPNEKLRIFFQTHKEITMNRAAKRKKPIAQYSKDNILIKIWDSARDIQNETGFFESGINKCCNGKCKTYKGYIWKYAGENT